MRVRHLPRVWLSGWLIAALLFAALVTAAHACPRVLAAHGPQQGAAAAVPDCDDADALAPSADLSQLCKAQYEAGKSSLNSQGATPDVPPAVCAASLMDVRPEAPRVALIPTAVADGPPIGAPPLYLSLLVLRN